MEFIIKEIGNGWLMTGPRELDLPAAGEASLFLPNLHFVAAALITWQLKGFQPAVDEYRKSMEG